MFRSRSGLYRRLVLVRSSLFLALLSILWLLLTNWGWLLLASGCTGREGGTYCRFYTTWLFCGLLPKSPRYPPFLTSDDSAIAFSRISTVISELHIGHFCVSIFWSLDNHFIKHSSWKICLQLGILRIFFPFSKVSMQITHSVVLNSSIYLSFFLNFNEGMSFLYFSIRRSWAITLSSCLSSALIYCYLRCS